MLAPHEALDINVLPARARRSPLLRSAFRFLFAALFCVVSIGPLSAQDTIEAEEVVKVRTDLVTVPVVVTDSHGRRVFGLGQGDFLIRADGRGQSIQFFATGTSRVALSFLLDASGSAREYLKDQRDAALSLFSRFGPQSEVAVLRFSDNAKVAAPFSVDVRQARAAFDFPAASGRHTAIFDAAMAALQLLNTRKSDPTERRIVILTSDGLDTVSRVKASDVVKRARKEAVSFYIIHFPLYSPQGGRLQPRAAARGFRDLAEQTGGHYFVVGEAKSALTPHPQYDLSPVFKTIEEDLAGQYLLGFYPDEASRDGRRHHIEVNVTKNVRRYRVRALRDEFSLTH